MKKTTVMRVHNPRFGQDLVSIAKQLSAADFYVELDDPGPTDTARGVGRYAIKVRTDTALEYGTRERLDRIMKEAIIFALADEVERLGGSHNFVLNGMWLLQPANRQQIYSTSRSLENDLILQPRKTRGASE